MNFAKASEDSKLLDILDHFRDLHPNTTMHPEAFLESPEALKLFDIAESGISAMADRIKQLSGTEEVPRLLRLLSPLLRRESRAPPRSIY
jgi:hypothetical protein